MSVDRVRVLRLFSRLNIGGPSFHVVLLTEGLRPRGYETRLVIGRSAPTEGDLLAYAAAHGVEPIQIATFGRAIRPVADFRTLVTLLRLMWTFRPTIVHTHTAKAGLLGRVAARLLGVPIVVHTYHGHVLSGYFHPAKAALFRGLERILALGTDRLLAVSAAVKHDLLGLGIGTDHKIRVMRLGLELEGLSGELPRGGLRREAGWDSSVPLVGIVGRLVPIKDVPSFLEAARLVGEVRPEVRFAIVGDGEERSLLEQHGAALGLGGRVYFHGWKHDMRAVFGDLDLVVNCSRNEGTPVALIEALAAGRPVVATRVGGTPDLLAEGRFGKLVPAGDPTRLAGAILDTLQQPEDALAGARAGQRYVLEQHSVTRLIEDMDTLYRELLAEKRMAHAAL